MGTTSEKLTYLNTTKTLIKEELNLGGANITTEPFRQYKSKLEGIYKDFLANGTNTLWNNWEKVSGSGTEISLNNTIQAKMDFVYKGNTSQTGTPTPDTPIPVQVVSGDNTIKVEGKNYWTLTDNFTTTTANKWVLSDTAIDIPAGTYEILFDFTLDNKILFDFKYANNTEVYINANETNTITFAQDVKKSAIQMKTANNTISNIRIIKQGESQSYPISLGNIELCKIGDYQDYIYKENDNWYKHEVIKKGDTSSFILIQKVTSTMSNDLYGYAINVPIIKRNYSDLGSVISNIFAPKILGSTGSTTDPNNVRFNQGISKHSNSGISQIVISIDKSYLTTGNVNEVIPFLDSKDFIFYFLLQTPTEVQITDSTLISQLEAIKKSYNTQTNISQTNADKPFILDVVALGELEI